MFKGLFLTYYQMNFNKISYSFALSKNQINILNVYIMETKKQSILFLLLLCLQSLFMTVGAQHATSNVVYADNQVRFTVITDGTLRLEWAADGKFTDNASFVAVNREYPQVDCKVKSRGSWVEITTSKMKMRYKKNSGKFTADNLSIVSAKGMKPFTWKPGTEAKGNLKGTFRTLDGYDGGIFVGNGHRNGGDIPMPIEDGLISTDGWTLIDDSQNLLFDNSDWPWVEERPSQEVQDWYFMAYGHDYKAALKDFTVFAGKAPLPPRYAFGYWWSRYWNYSDQEIRQLVDKFHTYDIPLDVLVVDMDWHYVEPGKGGWTGYTWNRRLFPNPAGFLDYLKSQDLQITLNLHPADGVADYEENYPALAKWMGVEPASKKRIDYIGSDKRFMSGWMNTILRPMEKEGVDFWWIDWQQHPFDPKVKSLSNTWWINYVMFSDMERTRNTRPLLYHRWGGLGNHRYQIGFSGDSYSTWKSLEFQPYFNSTASNVLYGYWSHDLGGHQFDQGVHSLDVELFTRWMQFGALSPIMRTHSMKSAAMNKEPWVFNKDYFEVLRNTILQRYQMAPYIYTMARKMYDEGISLCRPMYYDYPESREAYDFKNEYMFGDDVLVVPITAPMKDGFSTVKVWLPAGSDWYEWHTGTLLKGGQSVERSFKLNEYPIYVKAGAVLPFYEKVKNLRKNDETVVVTVFPGGEGAFSFYEDAGNDKEYALNYATTPLASKREGRELTVTIGARKGSYPGMPAKRNYKVNVQGSAIPVEVTVNGEKADFSYDGTELALSVAVPVTDCDSEKIIKVVYPESVPELNDGLLGQFKRLNRSFLDMRYRDAGIDYIEELGTMESTGRAVTYYHEQFDQRIEAFRDNYAKLPELLKKQRMHEHNIRWFLQSVNWNK